jgi:transcriptional regulator with XRE-family HTH domain
MSWLADRLAALLVERELTVDRLARQLAVERSRLNAIIAGAALPNDNLTKRLARVLGEDPEEWLVHVRKPADGKPTPGASTGFVRVAVVSEIPDGEMKIVCNGLAVVARPRGAFMHSAMSARMPRARSASDCSTAASSSAPGTVGNGTSPQARD